MHTTATSLFNRAATLHSTGPLCITRGPLHVTAQWELSRYYRPTAAGAERRWRTAEGTHRTGINLPIWDGVWWFLTQANIDLQHSLRPVPVALSYTCSDNRPASGVQRYGCRWPHCLFRGLTTPIQMQIQIQCMETSITWLSSSLVRYM